MGQIHAKAEVSGRLLPVWETREPEPKEAIMLKTLAKNWWVFVLRGVVGVLFGVMAYMWPGITLVSLVLLFGAYAFVDGVFAVIGAITGRKEQDDWILMLLLGVVGIAVGILTYRSPGITALALLMYIAAWAFAKGVLEIVTAIKIRKEIEGEWALALSGALSVLFAFFLLWNPGAGALGVIWVIAFYAILFGVLSILFGFKIKKFAR